jgi:dihydropyrimidinase
LSRGNLTFVQGDLRAVRGAGQYVKRAPFGAQFDALSRKALLNAPKAVAR